VNAATSRPRARPIATGWEMMLQNCHGAGYAPGGRPPTPEPRHGPAAPRLTGRSGGPAAVRGVARGESGWPVAPALPGPPAHGGRRG
jgi:hypothetical protein